MCMNAFCIAERERVLNAICITSAMNVICIINRNNQQTHNTHKLQKKNTHSGSFISHCWYELLRYNRTGPLFRIDLHHTRKHMFLFNVKLVIVHLMPSRCCLFVVVVVEICRKSWAENYFTIAKLPSTTRSRESRILQNATNLIP